MVIIPRCLIIRFFFNQNLSDQYRETEVKEISFLSMICKRCLRPERDQRRVRISLEKSLNERAFDTIAICPFAVIHRSS